MEGVEEGTFAEEVIEEAAIEEGGTEEKQDNKGVEAAKEVKSRGKARRCKHSVIT